MRETNEYADLLRRTKSTLIASALQDRRDIQALKAIQSHKQPLLWKPGETLGIDPVAWDYIVNDKRYDPKEVFCHPDVLLSKPITSLYYRGLSTLSAKAAQDYCGAVENIESNPGARLSREKAMSMATTYNMFTCSVILNAVDWTIEDGHRSIIANMGISLDGTMRNRVGVIGEERIRSMVVRWLFDNKLIISPALSKLDFSRKLPTKYWLVDSVEMEFSSEPDIAFVKDGSLVATVEIKGGIDPAGALERYGAAKKSFEHAKSRNRRCKNYYLGAVFTAELERRIEEDLLVEGTYNLIELLDNPVKRSEFFRELFHHTLRLT